MEPQPQARIVIWNRANSELKVTAGGEWAQLAPGHAFDFGTEAIPGVSPLRESRRKVIAEVVDPGKLPPPIKTYGAAEIEFVSAIGPAVLLDYLQDLRPDQPIVLELRGVEDLNLETLAPIVAQASLHGRDLIVSARH